MKKMLLAAAAVASLGAFAAVPFKLGVAGFTFHKRTLDDALSIMQKADVHYLCVKDFHLPFSATDAEDEDGKRVRLHGYKLETWDASAGAWGVSSSRDGTEYTYTSGTSPDKVRLTWDWSPQAFVIVVR